MGALYAAYLATDYVVYLPQPVTIRISAPCPDPLTALLGESGCFVTAWNPGSILRTSDQNLTAHHRLLDALAAQGRSSFPARAVPHHPGWPPEDGVFVVGIDQPLAAFIAERFGQFAIVMVFPDRPATLVPTELWHDGPR